MTKAIATIVLAILAAVLVGVIVAHAATGVPWPSISPSYRCDDGYTVFTLYNVGVDMGNGAAYSIRTPYRTVEQGYFWIASGMQHEWWFNAPEIPLTLAYERPDNGVMVEITQTCSGHVEAQATPMPTPYQWFMPWVTP